VEKLPLRSPGTKKDEANVAQITPTIAKVLSPLTADDNGVIASFGTKIALIPSSYANQVTYDTMHLIESRSPELVPVYAALVRESAQVGAFHLLGGIMGSQAMAAEMGPVGDIETRLEKLIAIARALGWGRWYPIEFFPGQSLVVRSPATQESAYYSLRHGPTVRNRLLFQQGAVLAIMQLVHRVNFSLPRPIGADSYAALFRSGPRFHVEETRSPLRGDDICEVVVEALPER